MSSEPGTTIWQAPGAIIKYNGDISWPYTLQVFTSGKWCLLTKEEIIALRDALERHLYKGEEDIT